MLQLRLYGAMLSTKQGMYVVMQNDLVTYVYIVSSNQSTVQCVEYFVWIQQFSFFSSLLLGVGVASV